MKLDSAALPDDAPHLLVVDDDRRIRDLLSRFLLAEGYRVTTADTAAEARAKLGGLRFDLLILDVMMPGQTGLEFAREQSKQCRRAGLLCSPIQVTISDKESS